MTAQEHIQAAIAHLETAREHIAADHKPDGYTSKPRPLRFAENALLALSQAYP